MISARVLELRKVYKEVVSNTKKKTLKFFFAHYSVGFILIPWTEARRHYIINGSFL